MYDMPKEIDVKADGGLRIITLNRPDELNAVNDDLHVGLAKIWAALNEDADARAAVITGAGRAFSAGGDFNYLDELRNDEALRQKTIKHGRELVIGMVRCRIPVIAAVNGPAVGLGCSLAALSDIVYMAEKAFFADPHVSDRSGRRRRWPAGVAVADQPVAGQGVRADRRADQGAASRRTRPGQPRRRRSAGRGDRVRQEDHRAAAAGGRGHQAADEHPAGEVR